MLGKNSQENFASHWLETKVILFELFGITRFGYRMISKSRACYFTLGFRCCASGEAYVFRYGRQIRIMTLVGVVNVAQEQVSVYTRTWNDQ